MDAPARGGEVPVLSRHSLEMGASLPRRHGPDRSQLPTATLSQVHRPTHRAQDHRPALHPPMGTSSDQLPPRFSSLTVERVLNRYRMPPLASLDQATGLPMRKQKPARCEKSRSGELIHVDIKKLGRIPNGGGHRTLGRQQGAKNNGRKGRGYAFLHHAIDTTPVLPTPRSSATNAKRPLPHSGSAPVSSSPPQESASRPS